MSSEPAATATAEATVQPTPTPPTATDAKFRLLPAGPPAGELPQVSCTGPIEPTDQVAVVQLRSNSRSGPIVLRDYRDPANPATLCEFGHFFPWSYPLLDARHLVAHNGSCYRSQCTFAVIDIPAVRYHWFALPDTNDVYEDLIAVSPELDEVAWRSMTYSEDPAMTRSVYVTRRDGDHVVGHLPATPGGFCGGPIFFGDYAGSGDYFYLLDYESGDSVFQVYRGLHRVFSLRARHYGSRNWAAVPIWSPTEDTLYYLRGDDVWRWTPKGEAGLFLPDVRWQSVTISPDGHYLAYSIPATEEYDNTYLVDLTTQSPEPELIGRRRESPRFLTDTQLWLQPEPAFPGCVSRKPAPPVIFDINENAESASIIRRVWSTWPAN